MRTGIDLLRRAYDAANKIGDLAYANYANTTLNSHLLVAGAPLSQAQGEAECSLAFAQQARFSSDIDVIIPQLALIRTLRGLTSFGWESVFAIARVLVLDPQNAGALLCGGLPRRPGRFNKGATAALDLACQSSGGRMPLLQRAVSCGIPRRRNSR